MLFIGLIVIAVAVFTLDIFEGGTLDEIQGLVTKRKK